MVASQSVLSLEQIKALYPNEWVLLANPIFQNSKILTGIVVLHNADKHQLAIEARSKSADWQKEFVGLTTIYTGTFPKNRRFWL